MRPFNLTDEEKKQLLKQHKDATKKENEKRVADKNGIPLPKQEKKK